MNKKKWIVLGIGITGFLVIVILIIMNTLPIHITYHDYGSPSTTYNIQINRGTKKMIVKEKQSCSTVDCNGETIENKITLTNEEFAMIDKILKLKDEKENLVSALSALAENDKVFYEKKDSFYEKEDDLNKDGIVTSREFGFSFLKSILEENNLS